MSELSEKIDRVFSSGKSIIFQNEIRRKDSEWYSRIRWTHVRYPFNQIIAECKWFGFETMEEAVDNCLKYINQNKDE